MALSQSWLVAAKAENRLSEINDLRVSTFLLSVICDRAVELAVGRASVPSPSRRGSKSLHQKTSVALIERLLTSTCRPRDHPLVQFSFDKVKPQPWCICERKFAIHRAYGLAKHHILGAGIIVIFTRVVSVG